MKITKSKAMLAVVVAAMFANLSAQGIPSKYSEEDLVWKDEFNGKKLNLKDWNFESHKPGWVNNELQSYGDSPSNTYVKDGFLVIQPIKTANKDGSFSYTSGRINTQGKHTFTYGRFEARIKMPKGQGFLPAFWMMPDDESFYGQWPKCGEIDIMEILGHDPNTMYGTIHYGEPHNENQGTYTVSGKSFADDFHVVAVEWEPGEIRYYCDGVNYKTINDWFTRRPGFDEVTYPAPFDQPFYIIFNVAVGGSWPGSPDKTTRFDETAQMLVDYVRVYQKKAYKDDVEKPVSAAAVVKTDATGNMVSFDEGRWQFFTFQGGKAEFSAKNGKVDIKPTADGPVSHAVQVVQGPTPLTRGGIYRFSFDASADAPRSIVTCISGPNNGWVRYLSDTTVSITTKANHFSWEFKMMDVSDATARIEFNLGNQKSLSPVHISNVRLEKVGEIDLAKEGLNLLPDGNYIHNGQFQEGKGRLAHWTIDNKVNAVVSVTNDNGRRELRAEFRDNVRKPADLTVSQNGFRLEEGKQYIIRLDAYASKPAQMIVQVGDFKENLTLTQKKQNYDFIYKAPKSEEYTFSLQLANYGATVYVDNISIKENSALLNGTFNSGLAAWELYSHQNSESNVDVVEEKSNKVAVVSINKTGNQDWMIQLKQNSIKLEKGKTYHVSFKAKSDLKRNIMWALQRDGSKDNNWIPYSGTLKLTVDKTEKTYEHTFKMEYETDSATIFTISMGALDGVQINQPHKVYIDDVVIEEVIVK